MPTPAAYTLDARRFLAQLGDYADRAGSGTADPVLRDGLSRAADHYAAGNKRRFLASQASGWPPLAESTRRRKAARGTLGKGTLRGDTDRLYNSLTPGSPDHLRTLTPDGIQVGSAVPYLIYHHLGTRTIPRREVWGPPDAQAEAEIDAELVKAVDALTAAIFRP